MKREVWAVRVAVKPRGHALGFLVKSAFPVSHVKVAVLAFGNLVLHVTATISLTLDPSS